jgi:DNA-binding PadR family transcriptional regulator
LDLDEPLHADMGAHLPARRKSLTSPVSWAALGLIIERPSYGYELAHRLERRYHGVVRLSGPGHIYAALESLENAGYIEPVDPQQREVARRENRRQPKVKYRATAAGVAAFRSWIAQQMHDDPHHVELLQRIASAPSIAGVDSVEVLRGLVAHYEEMCVAEASVLRHDTPAEPAADVRELTERLLLESRRTQIDGHFAWLEYASREIEAYEHARRGDESARP